MNNPYEVKTIVFEREHPEQLEPVDSADPAYVSKSIFEYYKPKGAHKMSICVLGYKHIEQTKRCVESILRFVGDIDYELILLDNASEDNDETLNYFQSVPTTRKKIIQVKTPVGRYYGSVFGIQLLYQYATGDIFVQVMNDTILTENSLQNMLASLESDDSIGMVVPVSSNAWMLQNPMLKFSTYDEMFQVAKEFNQYDPRKWEERLLIAPPVSAYRREVLITTGYFDFIGVENTLCIRVRAAGYKTILMGDTWICHDHDYSKKTDTHGWTEDNEKSKHMKSNLDSMTDIIFGGLKLFEDIMVFEKQLVDMLPENKSQSSTPRIFAVDVKSGQGLLDLKNKLRSFGVFETDSTAFTTQYKYHRFLDTTADRVICDRIDYLAEHLENNFYDYIIVGDPINMYKNPIHIMERLISHLSENGQMLFKVRNTSDFFTLRKLLGQSQSVDPDMPVHISYQSIIERIKQLGEQGTVQKISMNRNVYNADKETMQSLTSVLADFGASSNAKEAMTDIITKEYNFCILK